MPYQDRKSTRLNSSHTIISYAVFCLKKKKKNQKTASSARWTEGAQRLHMSSALRRPSPWRTAGGRRANSPFSIGFSLFFFFNNRAPPEIYPLPLPAALPI